MSDANRGLPRILLVDDSRMVRAIIIKRIAGSFDVREEVDGEAGWQTLLIDPSIQVVISDQSMPRLDGFGLIERIRASKIARIREMPVIMISGDEDEEAQHRAKAIGATDFITKGTGTAELLSRLDVLVTLSRTNRELKDARSQTVVDADSGLLSRAFLLREGEQWMRRAQRHGEEIGAVVVGFDHLDQIGAELGEKRIEQLLQHFAKLLAGTIRRGDSLARWSPELFAVASPNTPLRATNSFALRLRDSVETAAINYQGHALRVTVSIGIANSHADAVDSSEAIFSLAEQRMHKAAAAGGNRIVGIADLPVDGQRPAGEEEQLLGRLLAAIEAGRVDAIRPELARLGHRLLPLLRALNEEFTLALPLAAIEEKLKPAPPIPPPRDNP